MGEHTQTLKERKDDNDRNGRQVTKDRYKRQGTKQFKGNFHAHATSQKG